MMVVTGEDGNETSIESISEKHGSDKILSLIATDTERNNQVVIHR